MLPSWDLTRAPALRPRAADERRLQPAEGLPGRGGLRQRRREHAARGRRALADADHARRLRGLRRRVEIGPGHRAARSRGRDPRDPVVTDKWTPDKAREAEKVFGADDRAHPAVDYLHDKAGPVYLGGPITGIQQPIHYDYRKPPRHAERAARRCSASSAGAGGRVPDPQPAAPRASGADLPRREGDPGQPADPSRRRPDQAGRHRPLHPRALLRGGARQVSRLDHAAVAAEPRHAHGRPARGGLARPDPQEPRRAPTSSSAATTPAPARTAQGEDFYGPYDAQELFAEHAGRDRRRDGAVQADGLRAGPRRVQPADEVPEGATVLNISGTELRRRLQEGLDIPDWFSFPEVVEELRRTARRAASRASRCSSPAFPAAASRPSPTR
jgi:sulfate adenylyltransferase